MSQTLPYLCTCRLLTADVRDRN